jgi:hypothetical protein
MAVTTGFLVAKRVELYRMLPKPGEGGAQAASFAAWLDPRMKAGA